MLDARGEVLYVGKARALRNRVTNYTQVSRLTKRLQRMVSQTRDMNIVTTNTEAEALLLEAQLIKRYRPPYNVLLRDDKSFPFILLREDHAFPGSEASRRPPREGPILRPLRERGSVTAHERAPEAVPAEKLLDSFFANRSRPCLLYQIRRCSAPCVGPDRRGGLFRAGRRRQGFPRRQIDQGAVEARRADEQAADAMDFETAAVYRDRLRALTFIQGSQTIHAEGLAMPTFSRSPAKAGRCASRHSSSAAATIGAIEASSRPIPMTSRKTRF
jgi:excinuclease ABC subunit C